MKQIARRAGAILLAAVVWGTAGAAGTRESPGWAKRLKPKKRTMVVDKRMEKREEKRGDVRMLKLNNGLRVVIRENHAAPVVALNVWVNVGSGDETDAEAGIAHLHEHMLFKGTERRAVGEIAREVEAAGGDINAFTSNDHTVYHLVIASRFFDLALDIMADFIQHSSFDPQELSKEEEVVMEELRRSEDNPRQKIYRHLFETAYRVHPYRRPIIGYEATVKQFTREQIVGFYRRWYVPENMIVVIVGDISADRAAAKVQELFGSMPAGGDPRAAGNARAAAEPPQAELRVSILPHKVSETYLYLGFHTPEFNGPDLAELDLLSVILGMGESSRLTQRVRSDKQLVNKIWGYAYTPRDPGLFLIGAELNSGKAPEALAEILRQVYLLKHQPVEPWELAKAKLQLQADSDYARETVQGQARKLGYYASLTGDPLYEEKYLARVQAVTAEDLRQAATRYFTGANLSIVALVPEKDANSFTPVIAETAVQRVIAEETQGQLGMMAEKEIAAAVVPDAEVPASPSVALKESREPVRFELRNGIRLLVKERHDVPLVAVRAAFLGGLRFETAENNGINNFIAYALTEGTQSRSAKEIHQQIEGMAGTISGFSGRNSLGVTWEGLSRYFTPSFEIVADVLRNPAFPREELDKARLIILSNLRTQKDQPHQVALNGFRAGLYPRHPYGMNVLGSEAVVQKLSSSDLHRYYQRVAQPQNLVIAVVGDVDAKAVKKQVEALLGDWTGGKLDLVEPAMDPAPTESKRVEECMERNQTNLVLGFQGVSLHNPDRYPLQVLNGILSDMGGRLFLTLRDKQSLAYAVYAASEEGIDPGFLWVYIGTAPDKEETALAGILEELNRLRTELVPGKELERAKNSLIGNFEIELQRNSVQASHLAFDELYGLGFRDSERFAERIQAVTAEQVKQAAEKYYPLSAYVLSVVRPCPEESAKTKVEATKKKSVKKSRRKK